MLRDAVLRVGTGNLGGKSKRPPVWEVVSTRGDGAGVLLNEYYERVQDAWGSAHEIHTDIIVPDGSTLETCPAGGRPADPAPIHGKADANSRHVVN